MARRRAFIRAVLGGAAALALALGGVTTAAQAADDPVGWISGTVTRADDGSPVAGVTVSADGAAGSWSSVETGADGTYTLSGLPDDAYLISFSAEGSDLKRGYWQNTENYDAATRVSITNGVGVDRIDASLNRGATIAGRVSRADDGRAVPSAGIQALNDANEIVGQTQTDAAGAYTLSGLPAGAYRLRFGSPDPELGSEFWNSSYLFDTATKITLGEQQVVTGVNADLDVVGYVSGRVTRTSTGAPVDAVVLFYGVDIPTQDPWVDTDANGEYRIALAPGTYRVMFHSYEPGLMDEYWKDDARDEDEATLITIAPRAELGAVNAELEVVSHIAGTVALESAESHTLTVEAWQGNTLVASTEADAGTGDYDLYLPEGIYVLKASASFPGSTTTAAPQYFDGVSTAAEATPIVAAGRATLEGVDFTLVAKTAPRPVLELTATSVSAGGEFSISGSGFTAGEIVAFELHSDPIALGSLTADQNGRLSGTLRIPASAPAGAHTLVALGTGAAIQASVSIQVTAAAVAGPSATGAAVVPGRLAATGGEVPGAALLAGLLFMVVGTALVGRHRVRS